MALDFTRRFGPKVGRKAAKRESWGSRPRSLALLRQPRQIWRFVSVSLGPEPSTSEKIRTEEKKVGTIGCCRVMRPVARCVDCWGFVGRDSIRRVNFSKEMAEDRGLYTNCLCQQFHICTKQPCFCLPVVPGSWRFYPSSGSSARKGKFDWHHKGQRHRIDVGGNWGEDTRSAMARTSLSRTDEPEPCCTSQRSTWPFRLMAKPSHTMPSILAVRASGG